MGSTETLVSLPIGIKTMKNRTVKVAVHTVASVVPGKADNAPNLLPTEAQIKAKLNEISGLQINAYFDVTMLPEEAVAFDVASATTYVPYHTFKAGAHVPVPGNGTLDYVSWSSPKACLVTANRAGNYNLHVYLLGGATPIIIYRAAFEDPAELEVNEQALGLTNGSIGENCCIVDADRDAMIYDLDGYSTGYSLPAIDRKVDAVVETIAHEIGHIIVGDGHPDDGGGDAPLLGTDSLRETMTLSEI